MGKKVDIERRKIAPRGHFVVYVGSEMTRFVIPTWYLKDPLFQQLLAKAAEEFGFDNGSRITLPCDEATFHRVEAQILSKGSSRSLAFGQLSRS